MKVHSDLSQFQRLPHAVVTSGTFDGVHVGHRKILAQLREVARQAGGESVVLTFWPHPRTVVATDSSDLKLLSTLEERTELLAEAGINHLLIIPFTREFANLTSEEFIRRILVDIIGTRQLVIGYDHRFGRNREGSFAHLKAHADEYGFTVEEISRQDVDEVGVSSSKIRVALLAGSVALASQYLGRPYRLQGTVVSGRQLGRTIGYPTANVLPTADYKLVPALGVYAVRVRAGAHWYGAMLSIGTNPTVTSNGERTIEAYLFDFNGDLYGQTLELEFVERLRAEEKYANLEALKTQLAADELAARKALGN